MNNETAIVQWRPPAGGRHTRSTSEAFARFVAKAGLCIITELAEITAAAERGDGELAALARNYRRAFGTLVARELSTMAEGLAGLKSSPACVVDYPRRHLEKSERDLTAALAGPRDELEDRLAAMKTSWSDERLSALASELTPGASAKFVSPAVVAMEAAGFRLKRKMVKVEDGLHEMWERD